MNNELRPRSNVRRLFELGQSRRGLLIGACILSGVSALLSLLPAFIVYQVAEALMQPLVNRDWIVTLVLIAAGGLILRWLSMAGAFACSHIAAYDLLYDLRIAVLYKLTRVPLDFVRGYQSGAIKKILQEDVERIELFIAHILVDAAAAIVAPLATLVILLWIDWRMALATVALLPLALFIQYVIYRDANSIMARYVHASEDMNAALVEYVRAIAVVKMFRSIENTDKRLAEKIENYRRLVTEVAHRIIPCWSAFNVVVRAGPLIILPVGVLLVLEGTLGLPVFLLFLLIGVGIVQPALRLMSASSVMRMIEHGAERLFMLLDASDLPQSAIGACPEEPAIEFESVSYSYGNGLALDNISFRLEPGTTTVIVGPSGAGKSTVVQLLARFFDTDTGRVLIGNADLRDLSGEKISAWISFAFQDVFLFNDTVLENIRLRRKDISEDRVIAAAKAAGFDPWVKTLPQGYESMVGDRGSRLSGGQRQCLSIARALLSDAPIIVLDEVMASVDAETEARVMAGVQHLTQGKTVLATTHRLSVIANADQVLVLDCGRVVGLGTHQSLLAGNEVYRSLFSDNIHSAIGLAPEINDCAV